MVSSLLNVAVVFGGPSPEHDVSILTGLQAARALSGGREISQCHCLYWSKNGSWCEVPVETEALAFADGVPKAAKEISLEIGPEGGFRRKGRLSRSEALAIDAVINCCHGGPGEDGTLQGAFDLAGVSYTGPSPLGAALGMDKLATTAVLSSVGLPTLPRRLLDSSTTELDFPGPYIVKPRTGGSSIGIDVVTDFATAKARLSANVHLRRGAVIEPYRSDLFDLQVAVRTWPALELSAVEKPLRDATDAPILDYAGKYVGKEGMASVPHEIPAKITPSLEGAIRSYALTAASALGVRGVARIDFLSDGSELYVNELNTIPGSLSRHLFVDPQLPFEVLLRDLAREAIERPTAQFSSAGADGTLLRSAASISSKLG